MTVLYPVAVSAPGFPWIDCYISIMSIRVEVYGGPYDGMPIDVVVPNAEQNVCVLHVDNQYYLGLPIEVWRDQLGRGKAFAIWSKQYVIPEEQIVKVND